MSRLRPILCVPDVHAPVHDQDAWDLMMDVARDLKPETIIVIGDLLDCYSISSHIKRDRSAATFPEELEVARGLLAELTELGAKNRIMLEGNHEERLPRYLATQAPALDGLFNMPQLLKLEENGWEWVSYRDHVKRGAVHYAHDVGHYGKYAIYRNLETYEHSNVTGHTHRLAYIVEGNATGEKKLSASFGWLGRSDCVDYRHKAKVLKDWSLGFGVGWEDSQTGHCFWQPMPIVEYRTVFNGKLYKAPRRRRPQLKAVA